MRTIFFAIIFAVTFGAVPAHAYKLYKDKTTGAVYASAGDNREEYKPFGLDIGFQFFLQYRNELENRNQPAGAPYAAKNTATRPFDVFEAPRTIIDIKRSITPTTRARLVLDSRNTAVGNFDMYIRQVYGEQDIPSLSTTLLFGEIQTPTLYAIDDFWGFRVQGTAFYEREQLLTAGDVGVGIKVAPKSLPLAWHTTYTNGEGRTTPEVNGGKAIESRLTWTVNEIPGLSLSATGYHAQGGNVSGTANGGASLRQTRAAVDLFLKRPTWKIGGSYIWSEDKANTRANAIALLGNSTANMNRQSVPATGAGADADIRGRGFSVMGSLDLTQRWSVIGRFDTFDPDDNTSDNSHYRYIGGPVYKLNDYIKFLATYEALKFDAGAKAAAGLNTANAFDQSRFLLQSEIKF